MILFGDYHTHTKYSRNNHGKGTVLENAQVAQKKGLKQIAITDHGFNHNLFGIKRKKIEKQKVDIQKAKQATNIDILMGIEANFIGQDGTIDVTPADYTNFDVILCGYHKFVKAGTLKDKFNIILPNRFAMFQTEKQIAKNTEMVINALQKNRIDILTHLNRNMKVDVIKVGLVARDCGTYIELNENAMELTDKELLTLARAGAQFVIGSDAHKPSNVGETNKVINKLRKIDFPVSSIANLNKTPTFKKYRQD